MFVALSDKNTSPWQEQDEGRECHKLDNRIQNSLPHSTKSQKWKETRAHREMSRRAGKVVPKIKKSALRDELVILPGAAMSAADVVRALRRCIKKVEKNGMYIGRYESEYIIEKVDGSFDEA